MNSLQYGLTETERGDLIVEKDFLDKTYDIYPVETTDAFPLRAGIYLHTFNVT